MSYTENSRQERLEHNSNIIAKAAALTCQAVLSTSRSKNQRCRVPGLGSANN